MAPAACVHPRGQSAVAGASSANAATTESGSTCAKPKLRTPGVSMTQPPCGSGSAHVEEEVWRPVPLD